MAPTNPSQKNATGWSRRDFLKKSAVTGAAAYGALPLASSVHAAGSDVIKIGLIGCGGRGCGAAVNAMNSGKDVRLVALADLFDDRLKSGLENLKKAKPEQVAVDADHCFVGFDAYKKLIESVDVVLIAAAVHFHPTLLKAAVDAGKPVFCEKSHAIDVPGIQMVKEACEKAKQQKTSVMSGFCWRHNHAVQQTIARVLDGAIGDTIAIQCNYVVGPYNVVKREPGWNEMQYQMRDWHHFNWLSGDQTSAQIIHVLDMASWALRETPPVKAWGMGGRQTCLDPVYGDQFDHHAVVFEYANGVRLFGYCRDQLNCYNEYSVVFFGTKGRASVPFKCYIEGPNAWRWKRGDGVGDMYDIEHQVLFDSVRKGEPVNCGSYMANSSMLGIFSQMACYTGQEITWEQAMQSKLDYRLPRYGWDVEPPVKLGPDGRYPTAMPGITQFR